MSSETAKKTQRAPARKSWVIGIVLVFVLGVVAYFGLMNRQQSSTNHDYYRILYEASNSFKENLQKLERMHEYKESAASIRSLLPTYARTTKDTKKLASQEGQLNYFLNGKKLEIYTNDISAELLIDDLFPTPKKGFSQYLLADEDGKVLAMEGGERTISIVDLSSINQQIQRKNKQFELNLTDTKQGSASGQKAPLPSYSNHVDMKISYGDFRVFVFPFTLTTPISKSTDKLGEYKSLNQLYLVGLLPQHELNARDSEHWNISLLVVTIISLLFMWSMLRLYLLPKNQSITKNYRNIVNVSSYLFYIVIIALVLAYFQKSLLQNSKDQAAIEYAEKLNGDISSDLFDVFSGLNNYRHFYQSLLHTLDDEVKISNKINEIQKEDTLATDIAAILEKPLPKSEENIAKDKISQAIENKFMKLGGLNPHHTAILVDDIIKAINEEITKQQDADLEKNKTVLNDKTKTDSEESSNIKDEAINKQEALLKIITNAINNEFLPMYRLSVAVKETPAGEDTPVDKINASVVDGITELHTLINIDQAAMNIDQAITELFELTEDLNEVESNLLRIDINQTVYDELKKRVLIDHGLLNLDQVAININQSVTELFSQTSNLFDPGVELVKVETNSLIKNVNLAVSRQLAELAKIDSLKQKISDKEVKQISCDGKKTSPMIARAELQTNLPQQYYYVGSAATSKKKYPGDCINETNIQKGQTTSITLDIEAVSILINAFKNGKSGVNTLDFFSQVQTVDLEPNISLQTHVNKVPTSPINNKLLSVFSINGDGNLVLPSIYYQESNSLPATYNLSQRNYFKQVRDHKGWDISLTGIRTQTFKNVYIQRLLNLNNGTRGTTISMPMNDSNDEQSELSGKDHLIGADILLPSLSLRESPPYDYTYMIVERSSGEVLFHNDTERSLVENLFFSSGTGNDISQRIKTGLKQTKSVNNSLFYGSYHGQKGRFFLASTAVTEWAIVIFYPEHTLQAVMTNQFMFISVTFAFSIALMMLVIYAIRMFIWTSALKKMLRLPAKLNIRFVMLVSSVMLSTSYCFNLLGANLDLLYQKWYWSWGLPLLAILFTTWLVYRNCTKLFSFPPDVNTKLTLYKSKRGAIGIISAVLIITLVHFYYIHVSSFAQLKSLENYYAQIKCNSRNYELAELISTGLSRYPYSTTAKRIDPLLLLPVNEKWYRNLRFENTECNNQSAASSNPEDFPSMATLTGSIGVWQWINTYLWSDDTSKAPIDGPPGDRALLTFLTLVQALLLIALIALWFRFNLRVLWYRLYCPERFLQHIARMSRSVRTLEIETQNTQLKIECDTVKLNGVGLNLLLRSMLLNTAEKPNVAKRVLLEGFSELFNMSPCLQYFADEKSFLPNLKLNIDTDPTTGLLNVQIWDIETCLEKGVFRQLLLDLILELKSLTLANQLHGFTIFAGFHSLQRVNMKDPLSQDKSSLLDNAEYLSWAECLMDFVVVVPESFKREVNWELLEKEVKAFPELKFLVEPYKKSAPNGGWSQIKKRNTELYQESNWATINYLLLNADALYRFKWESCSSAEKLALLNLAKQNHINPINTKMIEHLALNGLITVRKGHINIVNKSFAHFVLHAESSATLNQLVSYGEAGVWKNYKLPIGIMILLIIGGIALTSGESIYIIAASMAGVLGTIASVTNSANLLRGGSKE